MNSGLPAFKPLSGIIWIVVGKLVTDLTESLPLISAAGKPAQLLEPGKAVYGRHESYILAQYFEHCGHKLNAYVVLKSGVTVGKLIQQAAVLFAQGGEVIHIHSQCMYILQGILKGICMALTQSQAVLQRHLFGSLLH